MLKVVATNVVVSKGYGENPALKFSDNGENVRFRVGYKVYDTKAENNTRWLNLNVKAFNGVCERIKKMKLKEGSYINILGHLDEETWEDQKTNEKKSAMVIVLDDVEYASSGSGGNAKNNDEKSDGGKKSEKKDPESSDNFEGYSQFGDNSFFDA